MPHYDEAIYWLQFDYTGNSLGDYMAPASAEFEFTTLLEGRVLFAPALRRLQTLYPRAYARRYTYMLGPLGPEYELEQKPEAGTHTYLLPFGGDSSPVWAHEHR